MAILSISRKKAYCDHSLTREELIFFDELDVYHFGQSEGYRFSSLGAQYTISVHIHELNRYLIRKLVLNIDYNISTTLFDLDFDA